jgi:hypothetical protein
MTYTDNWIYIVRRMFLDAFEELVYMTETPPCNACLGYICAHTC